MALTPSELDALPEFTTAQKLKRLNLTIAKIEEGVQSYGTAGRQAVYAQLNILYAERRELESQVAAEAAGDAGDGNVLVRFGQER